MTETPPNLNPPVTSPPVTSPPVTSLRIRSAGQSSDEGALHLKMSDPRYAVKWVDCTDGAEARHEKRDLTLKQAQREAGWLARHNRRFYPGDLAARSPFARLQVWLQCACGRDVIESREPHTLPGEDRICPYSGSDASRPADVMVASR